MTPEQHRRLRGIRAELDVLRADVRLSRDAAPDGEKPAYRYPLRYLDQAATEIGHAEQAATKREKGPTRGR